MDIVFGVLIGILVMTIVVTAHEFGHFIVAKKNGVNVKEFGIGFPPKAITWLHVPRKEVEKYCKKFKFSDVKTEKLLKKVAKKKNKKWFWIPLPKDEWYEESDEGLVPKTQDYLIFSINWLPIGGFCQMDGETNIDTRKGTFGAASLWSKTKILFAGVTMNWIFAFLIFTILAWTGMPQMIENQFRVENDATKISDTTVIIKNIIDESPAKTASLTRTTEYKRTLLNEEEKFPAETTGLRENDIIISAKTADSEEVEINTTAALSAFNKAHAGETVIYSISREEHFDVEIMCIQAPCNNDGFEMSAEYAAEVTLNSSDAEYLLGITMTQEGETLYRSTWSAPIVGAVNTVQITGETFRGLGKLVVDLFSGITSQFSSNETVKEQGKAKIEAAGDSVAGPVGIIGILFPAIAKTGLMNILLFAAIISISLACMNVLPIPALDGGRWFLIILYEKILRRKLTPEIENKIVSRAFIILLILAGFITILDVLKFFK